MAGESLCATLLRQLEVSLDAGAKSMFLIDHDGFCDGSEDSPVTIGPGPIEELLPALAKWFRDAGFNEESAKRELEGFKEEQASIDMDNEAYADGEDDEGWDDEEDWDDEDWDDSLEPLIKSLEALIQDHGGAPDFGLRWFLLEHMSFLLSAEEIARSYPSFEEHLGEHRQGLRLAGVLAYENAGYGGHVMVALLCDP